MSIPLISVGPIGNTTSDNDSSAPLAFLKFSRNDESAADFFGIQYLYKSGYSPECFITFIQKVWPPAAQPAAYTFSSFPPVAERLKSLRTEINEILPRRSTAVVNTEQFARFREHLLTLLPPSKPLQKKPTLLRPDQQNVN
jgi:predicted Zn-dependent protease